jgi:hypothetical protein
MSSHGAAMWKQKEDAESITKKQYVDFVSEEKETRLPVLTSLPSRIC